MKEGPRKRKEKKKKTFIFLESHRKQHGGRKGKRTSSGPGCMNPTFQQPGSKSSIEELLLLINKSGFYK